MHISISVRLQQHSATFQVRQKHQLGIQHSVPGGIRILESTTRMFSTRYVIATAEYCGRRTRRSADMLSTASRRASAFGVSERHWNIMAALNDQNFCTCSERFISAASMCVWSRE